ncbi:MAG: GNAT family N-acetyltransferase [Acidimicrobiales bacterium]
MLTLRPMREADLDLVKAWLADPVVAQRYLVGSTAEDEIGELRESLVGHEPTEVLLVSDQGVPIGWCQWYLCGDYPDHAAGVGAAPSDIGIDYAIGDSTRRHHGLGTALIAVLVTYIRKQHAEASIIADPEASNVPSRRVLEKNGFQLLGERPVDSEPTDSLMAIYRLRSEAVPVHDGGVLPAAGSGSC